MAAVNSDVRDRPDHLAYLLHMATRRLRAEAEARAPGSVAPLRAAQLRLLDLVPPQGARVTDLSQRLHVSKQGLGQLVAQLADRGYVEVSHDPADRRAKLIRLTRRGASLQSTARNIVAEVEDQWRDEVGSERYAIFRAVLHDLIKRSADGDP